MRYFKQVQPPKFIITKSKKGFTIKKRVRKTGYYRLFYLFKREYSYFGYDYVLDTKTNVGSLGITSFNIRIFKSKKDVKKYIKENTEKKYFIY